MSFDLKLKNGDISILNGQLETVQDKDKLIQDILKIAITPAGSNVFNQWYGSFISKTLIGSHLDTAIITDAAENQLRTSITTLQALQGIQLESFQKLSAEEQLAAIVGILVQRNDTDPRLFIVKITVLDRTYNKVQTSFTVSGFL